MVKRFFLFLLLTGLWIAAASTTFTPLPFAGVVMSAQPPQEPAREQFLPVDQLPPDERMPSAPFVVAAYSVVWILAMFYLWTIWKRIGKLEDDLQTLARRQKDTAR